MFLIVKYVNSSGKVTFLHDIKERHFATGEK